jgi:subfamily B ATP-binding cassette protein MsbA
MNQQDKYTTKYVISRLLSCHIKPYRNKLLIAMAFMAVVAIMNATIVRMTQPVVDDVLVGSDRAKLIWIIGGILGAFFVKGIAEYYQSYLIKFTGQLILTDIQMLMYEHLLKSDLQLIESQSSGRLISRFTNDISLMRGAVSHLLVGAAKHFLSVLFLIIMMFAMEPTLTLFTFLAFPLAIYPAQQLGRRMRKIAYSTQEHLGNYTAKLDETFQSIKVVKSYIAEDLEASRAKKMIGAICGLYKKGAKFDAMTSPIMEMLNGIVVAALLLYGSILVMEGKSTAGSLFTFITAFVSAYRPYKSLVALNVDLQDGLAASRRLFEILDSEPVVRDYAGAKDVHFSHPEIIFENVSLSFGDKSALKSLNLKIEAGKTTAIVGQSGGGKTSLGNLLVRFYEPTQGRITIGGHNLRDIKLSSLRHQIALITQDTMLFDDTILANIAYSNPAATEAQIVKAAKAAAAHEFIMELPEGYHTVIGPAGLTLSGGQRQRISIARAFLKDAPILVMDEATSALDMTSERAVQKAIWLLAKNRTTIIITHRLHSIEDSDKIIVMKRGKLEESGTHEELMKMGAEYKKLYLKDEVT